MDGEINNFLELFHNKERKSNSFCASVASTSTLLKPIVVIYTVKLNRAIKLFHNKTRDVRYGDNFARQYLQNGIHMQSSAINCKHGICSIFST